MKLSTIQNKQIKEAVGSLSYLIGEQEEKHYSEWYGVENPNDIPTEELEEHAYKSIRILVDIFLHFVLPSPGLPSVCQS